jgi:hypothetical protein
MRLAAPILSLFVLVGLSACTENPDTKSSGVQSRADQMTLAESNGGTLDFIVVAKDAVWDGIAGDYIRKYFTAPQYGLPQPEPEYTLRQVNPKEFNTLLTRSRSLIILEESADSNFAMQTNRWARPQLVATFTGSEKQMAKTIIATHDAVTSRFYASEIRIKQKRMQAARMKQIPKVLRENGIKNMLINRAFEVEYEYDSLLVMWNKTVKSDQGILVYFRPMKENELVESNILNIRDSLVKRFIPGEREGSYMRTETILPAQVKTIKIDGKLTFETKGLWRTEGEFKGGPFINYTILDEEHNQLIIMDAFLFAPEIKKRNLLFELEAMLKSVEFE